MAQQTINVGTAPNDGTGTPLRTAFQYTNSNFSELYTAVGPSGNNIVVPGNATITGDLTVDTSTLKVDSANNRVGIGTASPTETLHVSGGAGDGVVKVSNSSSGNSFIIARTTGEMDVFNAANSSIRFSTNGTLQATLNSTGLGVGLTPSGGTAGSVFSAGAVLAAGGLTANQTNRGVLGYSSNETTIRSYGATAGTGFITFRVAGGGGSGDTEAMRIDASSNVGIGVTPSYKLDVSSSSNIVGRFASSNTGNTGVNIVNNSGTTWSLYNFGSADANPGSFGIYHQSGTNFLQISPSGNVGIGVAPSALWPATSRALQLGASSAIEGRTNDGSRSAVYTNAVWNGTNLIYQNTAAASYYLQSSGVHSFYTAPSGTAGNAITFTQAMTLDASSNLLVATTNASFGTANGFRTGDTGGRLELGSANSTNANIGFDMYSTGAAAYRFYVGWGGTVFATNTTISAISDARLKENVQDIDVGLGAILALKPRKFDWKDGKGKDIKGDRGFIAQEFEQVFPNLIDEWKDAAPEGEAPYKSVRQDLIPVLVKAIQELTARVQTIETR